MKHIYRLLFVVAIFSASIAIFGKNIKEMEFKVDAAVEMGEATFPTLVVKSKNYTMNLLHGYNSNLNANLIRESMTPIGSDQTFQLFITENETVVKKLKYELRKIKDNELLDSGEISVLEEMEGGKSAKIKIQVAMDQGKEYAFKVTALTAQGKKIHYFTRLKYYSDACFLKEKLDFVKDFHEKTFHKNKVSELASYLETSSSAPQDNFAKVDIHSNLNMISWGDLKPKVVSEIIPTIKEFNIETGAIVLTYFVKADAGSGEELYRVKEFYRLRYTGGRMYLLKFEREMEALFDIEKTSVKKSEFKIGITGNSNIAYKTNANNSKLAFVREGELWYYHLTENKAVRVFSFRNEQEDYIRNAYNQHDIRILDMDEEGNINFMVYGYMNRGDYEGSVGAVVYKFYANEKQLEELVYIPLETTYQVLKENLDEFNYISQGDVFYFSIQNVIYSYSIVAKRLNIIAENISSDNFCMVEEGHYIAWQNSSNTKKAKKITILDLETEKTKEIKAPDGKNIRIIGSIDTNIVYGFVKTEDIKEEANGATVAPMYCLEIADKEGKVLKKYKEKNVYITDAKVEDNVIKLERARKQSTGTGFSYQKIKGDSILNRVEEETAIIKVNKRVTDLAMTEYYIALPAGFVMAEKPVAAFTKNTVVTESKTLRLEQNNTDIQKYYLYAEGVIVNSYSSAASAIVAADDLMGVVVDNQNQIIWERGGRYTNNTIAGLDAVYAGNGTTSTGACLEMVLKYNRILADAKTLSETKKTIYNILKDNLSVEPINLTGCTLDQILYFISSNRPVLAKKDKNHTVLITGYDEYRVTIIDPAAGKTTVMSIANADDMFKAAGNVFISYLQ